MYAEDLKNRFKQGVYEVMLEFTGIKNSIVRRGFKWS